MISKKDGGELAKQLRIEIETIVGERIKKHFLFEGLSEAITNVGQHAYPNANDFLLQQWWLSASYDSANKKLGVTFYDQGAGIPKTLPRAYFFGLIKNVLEYLSWSDSKKIEAAMETGRTSTGRSERGKGLQNLIEFAKSHLEGQLSIYSLHGMYRQCFTFVGNEQKTNSIRRDHNTSIGGTLIEWSVKL